MTEKNKKEEQIKLPCGIVQDLLPLYHDGVVSDVTRQAVGEHLSSCEKCTKEYQLLKEKLPEASLEAENENQENRVSAFLKKVRKLGILKGTVVTALIVALIIGLGYVLTQIPLVQSKEASIKYVFEEEGSFFIVYKVRPYDNPTALETEFEERQIELTYKVPVIHFPSEDDRRVDVITLEQETIEENGCEPAAILLNGKTVYEADAKQTGKTPEYVKVYFEYAYSKQGLECSVDENGIALAPNESDSDGENADSSKWQVWDWEGNRLEKN